MVTKPQTRLAVRLLTFLLIMGVVSTGVLQPAHAAPLAINDSRTNEKQFSPNLVQEAGFPSTAVLDDFNRPDGPLGSNWEGVTEGYAILGHQVNIGSGGNIYWSGTTNGADQEAFVTFTHIDPSAGEINLILKGQSNISVSPGQVSVLYSPSGQYIQVWTHHSAAGWQQHGQTLPAVFVDGDQFGAIARANGQIEVYRNGVLLGTWSVINWVYFAQSGYIGMSNFSSGTTTLDNFGGGTIAGSPTPTPTNTGLPTPGGAFPSTSLLDDFNRSDGPLGSNWGSILSGYTIESNLLRAGSGGNIYWQPGFFGVDQEAFVTFTHLDPTAGEINLVLKAQSNSSINPGQISVMYSPSSQHIQVWAYSNPGVGWQQIGQTLPAIFSDGDQFGVRAKANGQLEVYKNGIFLSSWNVSSWPYYAQGGFIGLSHFGGSGATLLNDFGGGTIAGSSAPTFTPTTNVCTDPTTCNPVEAKPAVWLCNIPECVTGGWQGGVIDWPSWSAYQNNARTGDNSRSVYSPETNQPLYPYMGSWADGCQVTSVTGTVLIIEWQRGTDVWRSTFLEPGQSHTIDLISPEDNAVIEAPDGAVNFSVSLANCTPQNIYGPTSTPSMTATVTPSYTPTETLTPTSTSTATFTPSATNTPSFTPTPTFTPSATNTLTFTPTNTATRKPTITATPTASNQPLYISLADKHTVGGISAADEDILSFNGQVWSMFFDGSDVGTTNVDLTAFSFIDSNSLLMTFGTAVTLNGFSVTPQDVVRFDATSLGNTTAGTFSMYFDGSDVGLTTSNEAIDALDLFSGDIVVLSTVGDVSVTDVTGSNEDLLAFTATSLGSTTSGTWSIWFDGSDVGLGDTADENMDAVDVASDWTVHLSTVGNFAVPGVSGANEDVFVCTPTSIGAATTCTYSSALYFDGSIWGLSANEVDGFNTLPPSSP